LQPPEPQRWYGAAALAATTPRPLNAPGLAVAAIGGLPWFTDARNARLVLAACCRRQEQSAYNGHFESTCYLKILAPQGEFVLWVFGLERS
jgi:hypothetical protein